VGEEGTRAGDQVKFREGDLIVANYTILREDPDA
jgi:hypothetical protein